MGTPSAAEAQGVIDLLVRGGYVVTPHQEGELEIGVKDGRVAYVAPAGAVEAEAVRTIDATGQYVFPGGVEPHAHIHEPMHRGWSQGREQWLQSPEGATRAALYGGTTTVVSFAFMNVHVEQQEFDANVAVQHRREIFAARSHADFAFHPVLTGTPSEATLATIADAVADGTATFKFFTTDLTTKQTGIRLDNGSARALLAECARLGAMPMVHAEDDDLIKYMEAKLRRMGQDQLRNVHLVHTNVGEEIAVRTVAALAEEVGAALYVAHVCGAPALETIAARRASGQSLYGEALHNSMCFSLDDYDKPDGAKYHIGMGLRPRTDGEALWEGLRDGNVSTLATDEYTTPYATKMAGTDIESTPGGHVGIETRGLIGFSEGVGKRNFSLRRFVEVFSTNPARVTGLYPRKGVIAPGSDADLVVWDPAAERTISMELLHHEGDYSPWEGWSVRGWPTVTILRGDVVVENGRLHSQPGSGEFITRKLNADVLDRPAF
jgi:dihydropyrimidinase